MEIPKGRGDLKGKLLEGKYEAKLEFPGGCGGAKQKTFLWGEYGYFLELHNSGKTTDFTRHESDARALLIFLLLVTLDEMELRFI